MKQENVIYNQKKNKVIEIDLEMKEMMQLVDKDFKRVIIIKFYIFRNVEKYTNRMGRKMKD